MASRIQKLLADLRLKMPVALTLTDPFTRQPMTLSYENLHELLVVDTDALMVDSAVVSNLYAEMVRYQKAAEWQAARAASRFAQWKAERVKEARKGKTKPTVQEVEASYRTHEDYDEVANEEARFLAIAGVLDGLAWGFKMKADMMSDHARIVSGYESAVRNESAEAARMDGYARMTEEVGRIASMSGAQQSLAEIDEQVRNNNAGRKARPLPGENA